MDAPTRNGTLLKAQRIPTGEADLILGCDMLTAGAPDAIAKMRPGRTYALVNTFEQPTGHFAQNPDWIFPAAQVRALVEESVDGRADFIDATHLATRLTGDAIAANLFLLGFAFQKGSIPLSSASLTRAIEINGVAVKANQSAFRWGRKAALDLAAVVREASPAQSIAMSRPQTVESLISNRVDSLTTYQDTAYARQYADLVGQVLEAEAKLSGQRQLTRAVATNLFKLMAYKDEYEVARLYSDGRFHEKLAQEFDGKAVLRFHLAPPILGKKDPQGWAVKRTFGPWMVHFFRMLAALRRVRGTPFDVFGMTAERRGERHLIQAYRKSIQSIVAQLNSENMDTAIAIARLPEQIRGFGHVKSTSMAAAQVRWDKLTREFSASHKYMRERVR